MAQIGTGIDEHGLRELGLDARADTYWNLPTARLLELGVVRGEGMFSADGAFCTITAPYTGRSPDDKFVVDEPSSSDKVWWGKVNAPIGEDAFEKLRAKIVARLNAAGRFVSDCSVGADPKYAIGVRVVSDRAWSVVFARNMFLPPIEGKRDWTVLHAPSAHADPATDGTNSEVFVVLHLGRREVLIGGSQYAGEMKKSMFTVMNYVLPLQGVFPMHCSANMGGDGRTAVFFGLSGTGKTTLSADPSRKLIGDDEHGWSDRGIFNFEGGCYAKVIRLSPEGEPQIYAASSRFGAILENVVVDETTRRVDLEDASITENTRSSYPLSFIPNAAPGGVYAHPNDVVFLTADAFGVLPPISRLTSEQARYWFLSGYTARVAGTERGITEPKAAFSVCFGAPFLPLPPNVYSELLAERIARHASRVWLVNTGWTGGPAGVGHRMKLAHTRDMLSAALEGRLDDVAYKPDPVFGVEVPTTCPNVPNDILQPREAWSDQDAYDEQAAKLSRMFRENFTKFEDRVPADVRGAGPKG